MFHVLVLVRSDNEYLTGLVTHQVNMQMPFVFQDLGVCISNHPQTSLLKMYANQLACIKRHLFDCLLRSNNPTSEIERHSRAYSLMSQLTPRYCGAFSWNEFKIFSSHMKYFIKIIKGHILYHEVLKFNFTISLAISCDGHGLSFYYTEFRSDIYCGRRVPWTVIIPSDKSYIDLVITNYLDYELLIFYSSFQNNWIRSLVHVQHLHPQNIDFQFNREKINSVQCYILVEHSKLIYLNLMSTGPVKGSIIVNDGPGRLSNTILEHINTISPINVKATTTAYWAFVDIILPQKTDTLIKIRVQVDHIMDKVPSCFRRAGQYMIYIPETSIYRTNVVCSSTIRIGKTPQFLGFNIHNFFFHGPNKLTGISSSQCQYGGLTVHFYAGDKVFEVCQDTNDLRIGSETHRLSITLVWFHGYSRGLFLGQIESDRCRSLYLERESPELIYKHDIITKMEATPHCYIVVCPPLHMDIQQFCTIQLGPPSVGTTSLKILTRDTLESCNIRLTNEHTEKLTPYTINASSTANWPFGLNNNTQRAHERYVMDNKFHNYEFLHFARIQLQMFCSQKYNRKQMAVLVKVSGCQKRYDRYIKFVANNIASLTESCMRVIYPFLAVKGEIYSRRKYLNYHDFIYTGDGEITTGHDVTVEYTSCPVECRNFNYSVFVRTTDDNTIIEYTAQVDQTVFTGFYHKGFRATINIPENDCVFKQVCHMRLIFIRSAPAIGRMDYDLNIHQFYRRLDGDMVTGSYDLGSYEFYNKR